MNIEKQKPLVASQLGASQARQRLATSRNRVLRGPGVTLAAKRTQGAHEPCDRAPKGIWKRESSWYSERRQHQGPVMRGVPVPPGSESTAPTQGGRPGTWEILTCPLKIREATPVTKTRPCVAARPRREQTVGPTVVTAARRKRSGAGSTAGSRSSSLHRGSGRTNPRDPVEGRENRSEETVGGNDAKDTEP